jgi:hypothetical protein
MIKKTFVLTLLLLFGNSISAQDVLSSRIYENSYWIDSLRFYSVTAEYQNTSSNDIFLWYSTEEGPSALNNGKDIFPHYIFKLHKDFSLFNLLSERILDDANTIVFETFLKRMAPGEVFKTIILGEFKNDSTDIFRSKNFLKKNVYYVSFPEILKIGDFKTLHFDYYPVSCLIIPYNQIINLESKCKK